MRKERLFKYISLDKDIHLNDKKLSDIAMNKAWLSIFGALNDPFEAKATYFNRELLHNNSGASNLLLDFMELLINYLNDKYVVYSLTGSSYDCLPMWAHYANNHQGFCVEYELDTSFYDLPDVMCDIKKVDYSESRKSITAYIEEQLQFYEDMKSTYFAEPSDLIKVKITDALIEAQNKNFFTKHLSWSYENEYRLIYTAVSHGDFPHGNTELINQNLKLINAKLLDLQKERGILVNLSEIGLCVSNIYVGIECNEEYSKLLNRISSSLGCGNAHKVSISKQCKEFRLSTTEIIGY
ncbi:MAG: DUF2971 domain-containing protein [Eubacteriales bacterium]